MTGLQNLGVHAICLPMAKSEVDQTTRDYVMCIAEASGWFQKIKALRKFVAKEAVLNKVSIISFCFRPDLLSVASGMRHISISSLRGSLTVNYQMQYGILGKWLAILHYTLALLHTRTVVLNQSMFKALEPFSKRLEKIENFINEQPIDRKRNECSNTVFIFVGGLTKRKGVLELIDAFSDVQRRGRKFKLLILGEGPERERIVSRIQKHGLVESVSLLGQIKEPFDYLATADYFVLPSHSEGTSRAAMEALYAGVPCIMRDVDSNADLISSPKQGELFQIMMDL